MKITIADLKQSFPRTGKNRAVTGDIPIDFFNKHEPEIRAAMKSELGRSRVEYRGGRRSNRTLGWFSHTVRGDADRVKIYTL